MPLNSAYPHRRVSILPHDAVMLSVSQPKVLSHAVRAPDTIGWLNIFSLGHLTDAETANVVLAAITHQNAVEVSEADRTAKYELFEVELI